MAKKKDETQEEPTKRIRFLKNYTVQDKDQTYYEKDAEYELPESSAEHFLKQRGVAEEVLSKKEEKERAEAEREPLADGTHALAPADGAPTPAELDERGQARSPLAGQDNVAADVAYRSVKESQDNPKKKK